MAYRAEVYFEPTTGELKVTYEPEDQIIALGLLRAAEHVVLTKEAKPKRNVATTGITGTGKLDVRKGEGRGASKGSIPPDRRN